MLVSCLFYLRTIFLVDVYGRVLHSGLEVQGSIKSLELIKKHDTPVMQCLPVSDEDTIYWVKTQTILPAKANVVTIHIADYDIWHKWLGHPSPKALRKMPTDTQKFPQVKILKFIPIFPDEIQVIPGITISCHKVVWACPFRHEVSSSWILPLIQVLYCLHHYAAHMVGKSSNISHT